MREEQPISNPELSVKHVERRCCSYFGCGRQLTMPESLAGNKCTEHMKENKVDPTAFVDYPNKKTA